MVVGIRHAKKGPKGNWLQLKNWQMFISGVILKIKIKSIITAVYTNKINSNTVFLFIRHFSFHFNFN